MFSEQTFSQLRTGLTLSHLSYPAPSDCCVMLYVMLYAHHASPVMYYHHITPITRHCHANNLPSTKQAAKTQPKQYKSFAFIFHF